MHDTDYPPAASAVKYRRLLFVLSFVGMLALLCSPATGSTQAAEHPFGILLMAHGGKSEWNQRVHELVAGLDTTVPVELALGMADRATLAAAMQALEEQGVRRVAVVRLFVSGESFLEQTEYLLGIDPQVPGVLFDSSRTEGMRPVPDAGSVEPIPHSSEVAVSREGLVDTPLSGRIVAERALRLSSAPDRETVLVIAHGMGSADADARLVKALEARAAEVRDAAPFRDVTVVTLREDWADERATAEERIREVARRGNEDGTTIVVPFRITGFGPYAEVLEGIEYAADGTGLLPSDEVADWILHSASELACSRGWISGSCDTAGIGPGR